jgi:hypothetical protein
METGVIFKIGDEAWLASHEYRKVQKKCPVCFGKLTVELILGNEDRVILPCNYCCVGYDGPFGYVTEYEYISECALVTIDKVNIQETSEGETREYLSGNRIINDRIFKTKEEAEKKCIELADKLYTEQTTRSEYIKKDKQKSFSWNAGYHLREVKKLLEQAEYHKKMAVICKSKAKE